MPAVLSNDLKERIVKWYNIDGLTISLVLRNAPLDWFQMFYATTNSMGKSMIHTAVELVVHRICLRMT
jgi:hypothetical protein